MDIKSFVLGYQKGKAASGGGGGESEITVLLEPMLIGPFATDGSGVHPTTNEALSAFSTEQAPVSIEKGKTYIVDWDGTQYTVVCKEISVEGMQSEMLYLGDGVMLSSIGLPQAEPSSEPFVIMQATDGEDSAVYFITTSTNATHTFGLSLVNAQNEITVEPLTVTENGTYTAPDGTAYSPVTVNVAGGGGETNWVSATGSVAGTGGDLVITHDLGVVPDIFYFYVTPQVQSGEKSPIMQLGFSQAMIDAFGEDLKKFGGFILMQNDSTVYNFQSSAPIDVTTAPGLGRMYNANESTILIPHYSTMPLSTEKTVTWYAVGGITG